MGDEGVVNFTWFLTDCFCGDVHTSCISSFAVDTVQSWVLWAGSAKVVEAEGKLGQQQPLVQRLGRAVGRLATHLF